MLSTFNHVENKVGRKLGAPAAVKAAIRYNDLLRFWKLDSKHELITNGTKVKWIYLKDNPYKIEALAFFDCVTKLCFLSNCHSFNKSL